MVDASTSAEAGSTKPSRVLNLGQAAQFLDTTEPTLRRLMADSGVPVRQHGAKGISYEFDADDLAKWKRDHEAQLEAERLADDERVERLRVELLGEGEFRTYQSGPSPDEVSKEIQAQAAADKLALDRSQLLRAADIRDQVEAAFIGLRTDVLSLPDRLGRDLDLSREERELMRAICRETLRQMARRMSANGGAAEAKAE